MCLDLERLSALSLIRRWQWQPGRGGTDSARVRAPVQPCERKEGQGTSERLHAAVCIPSCVPLRRICVHRERGDQCSVKVSVSYLEIYNETFTDLLNPGGVIKLRENPGRREGVQMEGATEVVVNSAAE
eukprot:COSAG02_NODE_24408_length_689_cov_0.957627_1_plen_128_part_10